MTHPLRALLVFAALLTVTGCRNKDGTPYVDTSIGEVEDTSAQTPDGDDTGVDDTGADDTGADDTGADDTGADDTGAQDADGDGYSVSDGDCDDGDAAINPGAEEICDGADNDCDGTIDAGASDVSIWYADGDGDGYGDADASVSSCDQPEGYVEDASDCDDGDAAVNPSAEEICDGADNDCDGTTDVDASDEATWYQDADGDGYGLDNEDYAVTACDQPSGYAAYAGDCDDGDAAYNPGASEDDCADPNDYNCDGSVGYADDDGDGYAACEDCDDADASANPSATELCDGNDDDCDGDVDEADAADASTWYADADADGYGDAAVSQIACDEPSGYVADDSDCDDGEAASYPGGLEICDGIDNDCDGDVDDDALDADTWYQDADGDGYGAEGELYAVQSCEEPLGYTDDDDDCDDGDAAVNPDAEEICDGVDNNCDGDADEDDGDLSDAAIWYIDVDGDGFGSDAYTEEACDQPSGYVSDDDDCDDSDAAVNPDAEELCDGVDNDCDGETDEEDAVDPSTWYADGDGDGYGDDAAVTVACDQPTGAVSEGGDCDDGDADVSPGAEESCDDADQDCDGVVDEDASDAGAWYTDGDGDGYGDDDSVAAYCDAPSGTVAVGGDCDDGDDGVNPDAEELCDGVDNDCDGETDDTGSDGTWYGDADGDGYGDADTTETSCEQPSGYVADDSDCDDSDAEVNPGAAEQCDDGEDDDCDGDVDESCLDHCGTISVDETWAAGETHTVSCDVFVQGSAYPVLTIADGAVVEFAANAGLYVGYSSYGALEIQGDTDGVLLTSGDASPEPGDWDGLYIGYYDRGTIIEGATIEYGGGYGYGGALFYYSEAYLYDVTFQYNENAGAYSYQDSATYESCAFLDNESYGLLAGYYSEIEVEDSEFSRNGADGLHVDAYSALGDALTGSVITENDGYPVVLPAESLGQLDDSSTYAGNGEDVIYVWGDTVTSDATWQALDVDYRFSGDVAIAHSSGPRVTIESGATFEMEEGVYLSVGYSGYSALSVEGTASEPVTFTSAESTPAPGDWTGLYFGYYDVGSETEGLVVEYAGGVGAYGGIFVYYADVPFTDCLVRESDSVGLYLYYGDAQLNGCALEDNDTHGLYATSYSRLEMSDSSATGNGDDGVHLASYAELETSGAPTFTGNTLTGNGDYPVRVPAPYIGQLDASSTYAGNGDEAVYVWGGTVSEDATWQALDVPWRFDGDVYIQGSGTPEVEIEAGATFEMEKDVDLYVGYGSYASLTIDGTASEPVTFTSADSSPAAGDWGGVYLGYYSDVLSLTGVDISYGGGSGYGGIFAYYNELDLTDSELEENAGSGLYLYYAEATVDAATFNDNENHGLYAAAYSELQITDSELTGNGADGVHLDIYSELDSAFTNNTVTGNGDHPVTLPGDSVGELDASSTYAGNGEDGIRIWTDVIDGDATWQALDEDYLIDGDLYVQGSGNPRLDIEAGATLAFESGADLYVGTGSYGGLIASGTAAEPVTFTSAAASPSAGDWQGIYFGYYCDDSDSSLENAVVEYGGGNGYGDVFFYYCNGAITDSEIKDSSTWGIYRYGASPTLSGLSYSGNAAGDLY